MCGRYTVKSSRKAIADAVGATLPFPEFEPRYNIAPTQEVPIVRLEEGQRQLALVRWGLIPSWADDPAIGNRMINARSETVATKPAFRNAFRRHRCLVVADGFYEWQKLGSNKQPYYIRMKDEKPFAFAGLWERWEKGEQPIESCTILTTDANGLMTPIHERMPVILDPKDYAVWLDTETVDAKKLESLMKPFPDEPMTSLPVGTFVNNPRNQGQQCIEPMGGLFQGTRSGS